MGQVAQRLGFVEFVNVDTLAKESIVAEDKVRVWVYGGDGIYSEDVVDPDMRESGEYEQQELQSSFVVTAEQVVTHGGDVGLVEFLRRIGVLTDVPE